MKYLVYTEFEQVIEANNEDEAEKKVKEKLLNVIDEIDIKRLVAEEYFEGEEKYEKKCIIT